MATVLIKMSIPNKEGVYLLRSYSANGTLYKIGRTTDLKTRLSKYSPNYTIITFALSDNSEEVETKLKFAFNNRYKLYGGKEYFVGGINEYYVVNLFNKVVHSIDKPQDKDEQIVQLTEEMLLLKKELSEAKEQIEKIKCKMSVIDKLKLDYQEFIERVWSFPVEPQRSITNQNQIDNCEDKHVMPFTKLKTYNLEGKFGDSKCWVAFPDVADDFDTNMIYITSNNNFVYKFDFRRYIGQTKRKYDNIQSFTIKNIMKSDHILVDCGERKRIVQYPSYAPSGTPIEKDFKQEQYDSMDEKTQNLLHQEHILIKNPFSLLDRHVELSKIYPNHQVNEHNLSIFLYNKLFKEIKTENFVSDPKRLNTVYKMEDDGLFMIDNEKRVKLNSSVGHNVAILNTLEPKFDLLAFAVNNVLFVYSRE